MRIVFVHPVVPPAIAGQQDLALLVNRMVPLGLLQLAAVLERAGHETRVYDCLGPGASGDLVRDTERVLSLQPDIVGFSATTSSFLGASNMAALIKDRYPGVKVVVGGAHASAVGARLLRDFPAVDYLCCGEGEGLMLELAAGWPLRAIRNLVYRDGDCIVANPRRERICNLDELPFPAYEKLAGFPEKYHLPVFSFVKRHGATMVTSRGCPYACAYCDRTVFERQYASHSPDYIREHMRWLRDRFRVHHVNFYDDLFTANRARVLELCSLLAREPLNMNFNCAIRAGQTDPELLQALKRAGCLQVSVGIESGCPELLARHKSGVTPDSVRQTVNHAHLAGLRVKGLFIFGLPGETPDTVHRTSDFIASLELDELNISKFSPFPGAPLWQECSRTAPSRFREDWRLMDCLHFTYVPSGFESRHQMDYLYNQCIDRFYHGQAYQRLLRRRFWEHRWSIWHVLKHLPAFARAALFFKPKSRQLHDTEDWPALHPSQPLLSKLASDPVIA